MGRTGLSWLRRQAGSDLRAVALPWAGRLVRAGGLAALAGCSAHGALLHDYEKPGAVTGQHLKLEIDGVDVSQMGLYFAPNIIPALVPPIIEPGRMVMPPAKPDSSRAAQPIRATMPPQLVSFVTAEASNGEPPAWLVRTAASGQPSAIAALRLWAEIRGGR